MCPVARSTLNVPRTTARLKRSAILDTRGSNARIVVDEQCNTLDDIRQFASAKAAHLIQIKMPDLGSVAESATAVLGARNTASAYLGGSCIETDLSARAPVNAAVATSGRRHAGQA
ncbi:hypothetical protein ACFX5Q_28340 [Mesorhizobium sp. IMUNJ 23033]|uniref:hypothetical protein n=1 Tax=Mesorhizobium sp. IMUNJ 23033 TaxID=3378039 RepID=UPI00384CB14D